MSSGDDAEERLTRLSAAGVGDKSLGRFDQRPHRQSGVDQGTVGGTNSYSTISDDPHSTGVALVAPSTDQRGVQPPCGATARPCRPGRPRRTRRVRHACMRRVGPPPRPLRHLRIGNITAPPRLPRTNRLRHCRRLQRKLLPSLTRHRSGRSWCLVKEAPGTAELGTISPRAFPRHSLLDARIVVLFCCVSTS